MGVCARRIKSARANIIAIINNVKRRAPVASGRARRTPAAADAPQVTDFCRFNYPDGRKRLMRVSRRRRDDFSWLMRAPVAEKQRLNIPVRVRLWPLFVTAPVTVWISSFGSHF